MACGLGAAPLGERTRKLHTSYLGSTTFLIEHPQKKQIVNTPSLSLAHARFISLVGPWLLTHTSWDKAGDSAAFGLRQHGSRLQGCIPECVILAGSLHSVYSGCFNGNLFQGVTAVECCALLVVGAQQQERCSGPMPDRLAYSPSPLALSRCELSATLP